MLTAAVAGKRCGHRLLRAAENSIRRPCSHRRCSTVRGGEDGRRRWKAVRGGHAHSSHYHCLKRKADRLSTVPAPTATYNVHSRRALEGHACGQCGVCASGQLLGTRLAQVHARRRHVLLVRVCMDATHSCAWRPPSTLGCRRWHDAQLSLHLPQPHAVNLHPHRVALHLRREFFASRSIRIEPALGARASAAHLGHSAAACASASPDCCCMLPRETLGSSTLAHPAPLCSLSLPPTPLTRPSAPPRPKIRSVGHCPPRRTRL